MLSIYKASAGSGKTFALTREYIRMLLTDNNKSDVRKAHSRILAVTFTKKSTAEMKERILKELYILANNPDESDYIDDFLEDTNISLNKDGIQKKAKLLLLGILQDYNRFSVSTIDGFFQQVIRTFALELGLSTTYDLALDHQEIIDQAVDDIFQRIREANTEDKDMVTWLIEYGQKNLEQNKNWNPINNIKTFAGELSKERLIQQMDAVQDVFANKELIRNYQQTLENLCQLAIQQVCELIQHIKQAIANFDKDDLNSNSITIIHKQPEEILKKGLNATLINVLNDKATIYKKTGKTKAAIKELEDKCNYQLIPLFKNLQQLLESPITYDYITADAILGKLYSLGILQDIETQINNTNQKLGRLPISAINQLIYQIIDGQDAPFIYERIGQYYNHYMIDEFQDTSTLQWQNFKPLIEEAEAKEHDNMIVGDVKQSIYRFRNSDWHLLNQVQHDIHNTEFASGMNKNWRTARQIIRENEKLMQLYCQWMVTQFKNKYPNFDTTPVDEIGHIYSQDEMSQEPKKKYDGYFHLQFFDHKNYEESSLDALTQQLQAFQEEKIDLSRVTILTRFSRDAEQIAKHLIQNGFAVQSSEGLRIASHVSVQIIIQLLKLSVADESTAQIYLRDSVENLEQYATLINKARQLPLYDHIQALIDGLKLHEREGATPYLTAFQDLVFKFTQSKVADTNLFLKYWEQKQDKATIAAPKTNNAITIMNIHSSKGLEFDIVIIPFFNWDLAAMHKNDIIWCKPNTQPFNTLPLVPVYPSPTLLRSYFAEDYIQEQLAQYTDNLNLTYVALTRARYRIYIYGQQYTTNSKKEIQINNVGQLFSFLIQQQLDDNLTYTSLNSTDTDTSTDCKNIPPLPPKEQKQEDKNIHIKESKYISTPLNDRLVLHNRQADENEKDDTENIVELGNSMHLWLANIRTWEDAQPALQRLIVKDDINTQLIDTMQQQLMALKNLIINNQHNDWFTNEYHILTEQEIITTSPQKYRPDRIMIKDKQAIVIDYKFGHQQSPTYIEQIRDYILLLRELGYTTKGYIIYNQLQTIQAID